MAVREDCKHYLFRSTASGDGLQRCRLSVNEEHPFACPEGCLFFEGRPVSAAGWTQAPTETMSNTAHGVEAAIESESRRRRGKKRR